MKALLSGCLFLQVACSFSSNQATPIEQKTGTQGANIQQASARPSPSMEVPGTPEIRVNDRKVSSSIKGSAESHYITFSGIRNVLITDGKGNNNGPVSTAYKKNVPGVSEMLIGPESIQIITPTNNSYTMRFTGNGQPTAIEDIRGVTNQLSDATLIVRYENFVIANGRVAELKIFNDQVDSLKYDADGDGTPETVIKPSK